jgi:predicted nucleotidyltransferase
LRRLELALVSATARAASERPVHNAGCSNEAGTVIEVRDWVKRTRDDILRIAQRHGARNIRIFGSIARGDADAESDIDLLVDLEPGRSLLDPGGFQMELQELFKRRVDVVTERGLRERIRERV